MIHVKIYLGPNKSLWGKLAMVQQIDGRSFAQFQDKTLKIPLADVEESRGGEFDESDVYLGFGWHCVGEHWEQLNSEFT